MKLVIGFTRLDRVNDYIPMMDGYRDGAAQDEVILEVSEKVEDLAWCEAVYVATNAPFSIISGESIARELFVAMIHAPGARFIRALSVGDTVTLDDRRHIVAPVGWQQS